MKKILCALLVLITLTLTMASCDDGRELLGIVPAYMGGPVTTTTHEFTKNDFYVLANYEDGDEAIDDYEFYVEGMADGYYIIQFTYKNAANPLYVKCEVPIYPSDMEN